MASGGTWPLFVFGVFFIQQTVESCRDAGVVPDVAQEEIAEAQEGADHLGMGVYHCLFVSNWVRAIWTWLWVI